MRSATRRQSIAKALELLAEGELEKLRSRLETILRDMDTGHPTNGRQKWVRPRTRCYRCGRDVALTLSGALHAHADPHGDTCVPS